MKVTVIGLGPGGGADLTGRARAALEACDLIVGYTAYIDLVRADFPQKETLSTGMRREVDRCRAAVEAARTGKDVAVVCSGDSGVYGMGLRASSGRRIPLHHAVRSEKTGTNRVRQKS